MCSVFPNKTTTCLKEKATSKQLGLKLELKECNDPDEHRFPGSQPPILSSSSQSGQHHRDSCEPVQMYLHYTGERPPPGPSHLRGSSLGKLIATRSQEKVTVKYKDLLQVVPSEQGAPSLLSKAFSQALGSTSMSKAPILVSPQRWPLNKGRTSLDRLFPALCSEKINLPTTRIKVRTGMSFPNSQTLQQMVKTCSLDPSRKALRV